MNAKHIYTSLTRISDLEEGGFKVKAFFKEKWQTGDYVVCKILNAGSSLLKIELQSGRMRGVIGGECVVGALGERFATLEATGTWKKVEEDMIMTVLTGAGLIGKLTSKSAFIPNMIKVKYLGHATRNGKKITMDDFVKPIKSIPFNTPVILFVGTSMSAGKTTSARIVTNLLKQANLKVVGAKISGAGRFKDILAVKDVGADAVIDFVDAGLPSTICPRNVYLSKLKHIKNFISNVDPDFAVIEVGASPLEPYNGDLAIEAIKDQIKFIILCAADPYGVYGIIKAFNLKPDIVTGVATNTLAGRNLVENLCDVKALNIIDPKNNSEFKKILSDKLEVEL
ncbi:MAG: hypothetical protein HKO81_04725 [Flavobacteriaceae bacterium]|nr:hypothetical protein [Flavobacteriaceae bacterium]